jgi:4-amino-4-deoxy-L-arabinose transferase-like glycosyltransferase
VTEESSFSLRRGDPAGRILAVIAIGAIVRFLLAASVGLGVDESYAVAIARQFSLSYFDHPPLHFWIVGAVARLAHSEAPAVVRLPFVLCFAGTTWFSWRIGRRFFGERAALVGVILLNASAVFSLSGGGWVLPDGPLMLCTTAAVDVIAGIVFATRGAAASADATRPADDQARGTPMARWAIAGLLTGLAMLSKYHGVFVLAGTAVFLATSPAHRHWLCTPGPYLGALIALACFTPVIAWNAEHHWASFVFQGGRAMPGAGIHVETMLANIGGQAAWILPWIFIPLAAAAWRALRSGPRDAARWFLLCIAAGPIVVFTLVSLRGEVGLPHWEAPGWLFVFPMLGASAMERADRGVTGVASWLRRSTWGYVALLAILVSHARTGWIARLAPKAFERGDPTADLFNWSILPVTLKGFGFFPSDRFVAAPSWIQAGKAAVAIGPGIPVVCLCADPHHFRYAVDDSAMLGKDAVLVVKRREGDDVVKRFGPYFERIDPVTVVGVYRRSEPVMLVDI